MDQQPKRSSGKIYYIIIIIILIALNGIFVYNYFTTDKKLVVTEEKLFATDSAKAELEKVLGETVNELDLYKGKNAQLDAFLKEKNDSLQEYAERIEVLLRQGRLSREQLNKAIEEIDQLRYYKRKYLNQIDSLSSQITRLNLENTTLKGTIDKEKRKYEDLTMENVKLNNKVAIGAKLNATSLFITGVKSRSNGKERETNRVSQIEKIKVSFNIEENYVADIGPKDIYMKVIGPEGTTLYNELSGSGTFTFEGQESLYTTKKTIDFTQAAQQVTIYWSKGSDYAKGMYKIELFAGGLSIGKSEFELK
jgi:flagellar basal body-associated protein FliL